MDWLIHSVFLSLICLAATEDCAIDNRSPENAWEQQLIKDLKCNYDVLKPSKNNTDVRVKFILKSFNFDSKEEMLKIYSWMFISWIDNRLRWNSTNYDNITETIVKSNAIWYPKFILLCEVDWQEYDPSYVYCSIDSSGYVFCSPRVTYETLCNTKLRNWPFDIQKCIFEFGVRTKHYKLNLEFSQGQAVTMLGSEYGSQWIILDYEQEEFEDQEMQLRLTFFLERISAGLAAIVVVPTILLSLLTLTSLILEVKDNVRLGMISFSLLCHFYLLSAIRKSIPQHSIDMPSILLYLRGSIMITAILISLTSFLGYLLKKKTSPPKFMVSVNDFVLKGHTRYIIKPRWEASIDKVRIADDAHYKNVENWTDFANIINSVFFIIAMIFYVTLVSTYMPLPAITKHTNFTDPNVFSLEEM